MIKLSQTKLLRSPLILVIILGLFGCSKSATDQKSGRPDPYSHIENDTIRGILKRAIDWAGGWDTWSSMDTLSYQKHSKLYYEDGSIESEVVQDHLYSFRPSFQASITWKPDGNVHEIKHLTTGTLKVINGKVSEEDPVSLERTVMSAWYVLGMPFKLLDKGTQLRYLGRDDIDGQPVDVIRATYDPGAHDNHSTRDEWYYYFGLDGSYVGSMVYHPPTYAFIRNIELDRSTDLVLQGRRKSYRTDSLRNIQFLRAEFWYSDYILKR